MILAAAGSGKTSWIVDAIGKRPEQRALVVTFTTANQGRLEEKFMEKPSCVNPHLRIRGWLGFLLEDMVRPFQNLAWPDLRVSGLLWTERRSQLGVPKARPAYYFTLDGRVYSDKVAEAALECDRKSGGEVIKRLRLRYDHIFVDEVQDLCGYDLDVIELIMKKGPKVTMVGDPRQGTYSTSASPRYSQYRGDAIERKFIDWERASLCRIDRNNRSYRCCPPICRLADEVYPAYRPGMKYEGHRPNKPHEGVFAVAERDVPAYRERYAPQVLHNARTRPVAALGGRNFGETKGLEFERVLIVPTDGIRKWLTTGQISEVGEGIPRAKLYVAITRAMHSVAFVHSEPLGLSELVRRWEPQGDADSGMGAPGSLR